MRCTTRRFAKLFPLALLGLGRFRMYEAADCSSLHEADFQSPRFEERFVGAEEIAVCECLGHHAARGGCSGLQGGAGENAPVVRPIGQQGRFSVALIIMG